MKSGKERNANTTLINEERRRKEKQGAMDFADKVIEKQLEEAEKRGLYELEVVVSNDISMKDLIDYLEENDYKVTNTRNDSKILISWKDDSAC